MRRHIATILTLSAMLGFVGAAHALTSVGGTISTSTTWTTKGSPYIVGSTLTVPKGVVLSIGPGVAVQFDANVPMIVEGQIGAAGTETSPITFGLSDRNTEGWAGIQFLAPTVNSFDYTTFSGGLATGTFQASGGAIFVNNASADVTFNYCTFDGNSSTKGNGGALHATAGGVALNHCLFVNNSASGNGGAVSSDAGVLDVVNCTFTRNTATGGGAIRSAGTLTIVNSILWLNTPDEVLVEAGTATAAYSDFTAIPKSVEPIAGNISADPLFVGPKAGLYTLQAASPCIDAGDPKGTAPDPDGTTADMGAFYYDQTPSQSLDLPSIIADETSTSVTVEVTGTLITARGVSFAFLFDPSVVAFSSMTSTAFDGLADATTSSNVVGDTVFVAMAASVEKSLSDSVVASMTFDVVTVGTSSLTFLSAYADVDEETPALSNGSVNVSAYYGDATGDGSVSALDASKILQFVVHNIYELDLGRSDVSGNSKITAYDAALVLYHIVMPSYVFPANGGVLIKAAREPATVALNWERTSDGWRLLASESNRILSGELSLVVGGTSNVFATAPGTIEQRREGDILHVGFIRTDGPSELLTVKADLATPPQIASALLNENIVPTVSANPAALSLAQNAPNPFNPSTSIRFSTPGGSLVRLVVFDANGRVVRTLMNDTVEAGSHEVVWDGMDASGRSVASGVYLLRMESAGQSAVRRMTLLR